MPKNQLNVPKTKWDDAEEYTIFLIDKLVSDNFEYALKSANRPKPTAVSQTEVGNKLNISTDTRENQNLKKGAIKEKNSSDVATLLVEIT